MNNRIDTISGKATPRRHFLWRMFTAVAGGELGVECYHIERNCSHA